MLVHHRMEDVKGEKSSQVSSCFDGSGSSCVGGASPLLVCTDELWRL